MCITNTEETQFFEVAGIEYSELDTIYHELPENYSKSLIILVRFNIATEINLKISYLPQVENDIVEALDSLSTNKIALHKDPSISTFKNSSKPFVTRDVINNLMVEESILKDDENLVSLFQSHSSSPVHRFSAIIIRPPWCLKLFTQKTNLK